MLSHLGFWNAWVLTMRAQNSRCMIEIRSMQTKLLKIVVRWCTVFAVVRPIMRVDLLQMPKQSHAWNQRHITHKTFSRNYLASMWNKLSGMCLSWHQFLRVCVSSIWIKVIWIFQYGCQGVAPSFGVWATVGWCCSSQMGKVLLHLRLFFTQYCSYMASQK